MSRVRYDEKLLFSALDARGYNYDRIDDRNLIFSLGSNEPEYDVYLLRSISQSRTLYTSKILNDSCAITVNPHTVIATCNDKLMTTSQLAAAGIPCPQTMVAFTRESALEAMEVMGFPVVIKPLEGSWGRLVAKINDRDAAEAVLEDRAILGSYQHSIFYIQKYVDKPGRDIRVIVIDGSAVAAMYRQSEHWITNAARGSNCVNCPITTEIENMATAAAKAVGGGALSVDLFESPEGMMVCEVNSTMEFKACTEASGVDIAGFLVEHAIEVAK